MSLSRLFGLAVVYCVTCVAWIFLGGVTSSRTASQKSELRDQVASLWGAPHVQGSPELRFRAVVPSNTPETGTVIPREDVSSLGLKYPPLFPEGEPDAPAPTKKELAERAVAEKNRTFFAIYEAPVAVALSESTIDTKLHSDPRRKGLVWYSLYDVSFSGDYAYRHADEKAGYLDIEFALPTSEALYDGLVFEVNGEDRRAALNPSGGKFSVTLPVHPGDEVQLRLAYESRGSQEWRYQPVGGIQQLENFRMSMTTDFSEIDFPPQTLSPTHRKRTAEGYRLTWDFKSTLTGHGMGMVMPSQIQPGELSTALIWSAPVSLLFFFILLFVVAALQKLEIHPMNYLFLAAAFFSFHLLFSYSADHLTVPWAFGTSSVVSLVLVVTYLRLVVSPRFALREAALGQIVYLIGFSLAHFWEGYTGLTVTIMAILTLFLLMQATGRVKWSEVLTSKPDSSRAAAPVQPPAVASGEI